MKINKILVATDFSPCSDLALEMAVQVAKKMHAELVLVHINQIPAGGDAMFYINSDILHSIEKETQEAFDKLLTKFYELKGLPHRFVQEVGFSIDKIKAIIKAENADLVVMGSTGKNQMARVLFGSVATGIMRRPQKPLLLIPEGAGIHPFKKILLATDFDRQDRVESMSFLSEIARIFEAKIDILHVVKDETPAEVSINPATVMAWADALKGVEHEYHFVNDDDVQKGVLRYAYENGIEILAVLGQSYSILERLFHKSVSKQLVYNSRLPLLILPS